MDFVKGRLVRSKAGRDKKRTLARPKRKKMRHVAPTATVLENALLESDQLLSGAIAAYDAAHPL